MIECYFVISALIFSFFITETYEINWVWIDGSNLPDQAALYNLPPFTETNDYDQYHIGSREFSAIWKSTNAERFYLFGGAKHHPTISDNYIEIYQDLWRYDVSNNSWCWMSKTENSKFPNQFANYGLGNVADDANIPGSRFMSNVWIDEDDNLWLFGGRGYAESGSMGFLRDLWYWNQSDLNWVPQNFAITTNSKLINQFGVYTTPSTINTIPGARCMANIWKLGIKVYLFGGYGKGASGEGHLNDMWYYDLDTKLWNYISGSNTPNSPSIYYILGQYGSQSQSYPGARFNSATFLSYDNKLYLFGGGGLAVSSTPGNLNDMWIFDPETNRWAWISGQNTINYPSSVGTKGVFSSSNHPGGRYATSFDVAYKGYSFFMFGGGNHLEHYNEIWEYRVDIAKWRWIEGDNLNSNNIGVKNVANPNNSPAFRVYSSSCFINHTFYLFAGRSYTSYYYLFNDLWTYSNVHLCNGTLMNETNVCSNHGTCIDTNTCLCDAPFVSIDIGLCVCQEGNYYLDNDCVSCPNGTWSVNGTKLNINDCFPCLGDYACPGEYKYCGSYNYNPFDSYGNVDCFECPEGFYIDMVGDLRKCIPCPQGHYCNSTRIKIKCPDGYYSDDEKQTECYPCPYGYYVTENNFFCLPCKNDEICFGNYSRIKCDGIIDGLMCNPCPDNHICYNGDAFPCNDGFYIDEISSLCIPCMYGMKCIDNITLLCENQYYTSQIGSIDCDICPFGYYTNNSHTSCFPCISGAICNGVQLIKCTSGQYLINDTCVDCPKGYYCMDSLKIECPAGYYNNLTRSTNCLPCPEGTYLSHTASQNYDDCILCPNNMTSDSGSNICHYCYPGTFFNSNYNIEKDKCQLCPEGTYSNIDTNLTCNSCQSGYHNPIQGAEYCMKCQSGYFSLEGESDCTICPPGTYSNENGSYCELCPYGTYNPYPGASSIDDCIVCQYGGSELGGTSIDSCSSCPPGTMLVNNKCTICTKGSYSTTYNSQNCTLCKPGTFNNIRSATSEEYCIPCLLGSYSIHYGQDHCTLCEPGKFMPIEGSNEPCILCPVGTFSNEGESICHHCPEGTYNLENGSSSCIFCYPGSYSINSTTPCINCPKGTYQELSGMNTCIPCPKGTYNSKVGSISSIDCELCPIGTYSSNLAVIDIKYCINCPPGSYCDEIGLKYPKLCPKGTYSNINTSITIFDCMKCPKGTYSNIDGLNSELGCNPCPIGTYNSIEGSSSIKLCINCPPGTYTDVYPAISLDNCKQCEQGTYSSNGMECIKCSTGTYNEQIGSISLDNCTSCGNNSITLFSGSSSKGDCILCPEGTYVSNQNCVYCPAGTYLNNSKRIHNEKLSILDCISCGKGYYQPSYISFDQNACIQCEQGTYGPFDDNSICIECGPGYYSNDIIAQSIESCYPCPNGSWSNVSIGKSIDICNLCIPGTFNPNQASNSINSCLLCPPGTKSDNIGLSNCIPCSENSCNQYGSSFELSSKIDIDWLDIYDPSLNSNSFQTILKLIIISIFLIITIIALLIFIIPLIFISKSKLIYMIKKLDCIFSIRNKKFIQSKKNPTLSGGISSTIVEIIFVILFISIVIDLIYNNKIILESTTLQQSKFINGKFTFEAILVGRHASCNATFNSNGFLIYDSHWDCIQSIELINQNKIEGCKCKYICLNCIPEGNKQSLSIIYNGYIMTSIIYFHASVNYYIDDTFYNISGIITSIDNIFTGNSISHIIEMKLYLIKYISISFLNTIYDMIGFTSIENINQGYILEFINKYQGSSKSINNFQIENGLKIDFDIIPVTGIKIYQEKIQQNLLTFISQLLSLFSISFVIGNIIFIILEFIIQIINILKNRSKKVKPIEIVFNNNIPS